MPEIGPMEILIVAVVALLVFGPEKLPDMARNVGRTISDLRRTAQEMRDEFTTELDDDSPEDAGPVDPDADEDYVVEDEPPERKPEARAEAKVETKAEARAEAAHPAPVEPGPENPSDETEQG